MQNEIIFGVAQNPYGAPEGASIGRAVVFRQSALIRDLTFTERNGAVERQKRFDESIEMIGKLGVLFYPVDAGSSEIGLSTAPACFLAVGASRLVVQNPIAVC